MTTPALPYSALPALLLLTVLSGMTVGKRAKMCKPPCKIGLINGRGRTDAVVRLGLWDMIYVCDI